MSVLSARGAALLFAGMEAKVRVAERHALEKAAVLVEAEAKAEIGTYQPEKGPFVAWAELADSTKADRRAKGFSENDPLLRRGDLRDSVQHTVRGHESAHVGSDSMVAVYQELGTSRIPPRSFLGGAAFRKAPEVKKLLGDAVVATIAGKRAI